MKRLNAAFVYLFANFIMGMAGKIIFTTYVIYRVDVVGLDPLQLVLLGTALEVTIFIFEVPTGVVADIYSRRLSTIVGVALIGFGHMLEGARPLFEYALAAQVLWGFGWTFISGAFSAWISDEVGVERVGALFLRSNQLALLGNALGIPVAVWVARQGIALPYLVGGALWVALAIFLLFFMPEEGFTRVPKEEREGWSGMLKTFSGGLNLVRGRRILMIYAVIGLFVGLYSEAWDRLSQPFLLENYTFPDLAGLDLDAIAWFGILNAIFIPVGMLSNELAKRMVDTARQSALLRSLQWVYGLMVAAILIFTLSGNFYLAIAATLLFNGARGVSFSLGHAWVNHQLPSKVRATVLSMTGQIDAFGELAGGPVLGTIGRLQSLRAALITSALVLSPVSPLFKRIEQIQEAEQTSNEAEE
jgi:DHA3 family tetracycline resistance protein-like MFS transporter